MHVAPITKKGKGRERMFRFNTVILILAIAMLTCSDVAQSADFDEELRACVKMTDEDARLACFDKVGERALLEQPAGNEPTQKEVDKPEVVAEKRKKIEPIPDDFGSPKAVQFGGLITSCQKGVYGDWYFFFENGQVWKEKDRRNLRFKECNFNATITKDLFGYTMKVDGIKGTIRVRRHR
jgi:hypothetical protein